MKETDAGCVKKAANGDPKAWSELVEQYSAYVYTLIRSARVSESEEADAFQYVFIELYKALPSLKNITSLAPWLRQTTLRHAIRLRRKASAAATRIEDVEQELTDPSFEKDLMRAEEGRAVREAVASLQERCRELVQRLFFSDPPEPYQVVADALGIKASSIAMTRQRCLEALERALSARGILG